MAVKHIRREYSAPRALPESLPSSPKMPSTTPRVPTQVAPQMMGPNVSLSASNSGNFVFGILFLIVLGLILWFFFVKSRGGQSKGSTTWFY